MAGRFTEAFGGDGAVEITLRAPIPVDRRLQVVRDGERAAAAATATR